VPASDEGYPIVTKDVIIEELHVGTKSVFADAGFTEVSHPTLRRVVMRIDSDPHWPVRDQPISQIVATGILFDL